MSDPVAPKSAVASAAEGPSTVSKPRKSIYLTADGKTTENHRGRIMKSNTSETFSTWFPWLGAHFQKPLKPAKKPAVHSSNWRDRFVRLVTVVFHYALILAFNFILSWVFTEQQYFDPRGWQFFVAFSVAAQFLVMIIDEISNWLLKSWLPRCKGREPYKKGEVMHLLSFLPGHTLNLFIIAWPTIHFGIMDWTYDTTTPEGLWKLWKEFIPLLMAWNLTDQQIPHTIMHNIPKLWGLFPIYEHHKTHHTAKTNMTFLRGFKAHPVDFALELEMVLPWLIIRKLLGYEQIHFMAWLLVIVSALYCCHATNPMTPFWWNPLLDYWFIQNPAHHLHHAVNKAHYSPIPYGYLFPGYRQRDIDEYNKVMETDFTFD